MKKYKLIKEYPGSIKLGEILEVDEPDMLCARTCLKQGIRTAIPKAYVLQYPDFWEEIIEKDYEILSFIRNGYVYTVRKNGRLLLDIPEYKGFNAAVDAVHWTEATNKGFNIHSVKRLSDGEAFTIGDKCNYLGIEFIIKEFSVYDNEIYIRYNEAFNINLLSIQDIKKPLFTTEDGVDIYNGDIVYYTHKQCNHNSSLTNIHKQIWNIDYCVFHSENIHFSTKQAAEEWIIMNKPCLSINDLTKASTRFHLAELYKKDIIKYVKEKLNLKL